MIIVPRYLVLSISYDEAVGAYAKVILATDDLDKAEAVEKEEDFIVDRQTIDLAEFMAGGSSEEDSASNIFFVVSDE